MDKIIRSTDKLAKWCSTGVQGAIGARVMEPIYVSNIVFGSDTNDIQVRKAPSGHIFENVFSIISLNLIIINI